jgi:hypothetical protein
MTDVAVGDLRYTFGTFPVIWGMPDKEVDLGGVTDTAGFREETMSDPISAGGERLSVFLDGLRRDPMDRKSSGRNPACRSRHRMIVTVEP